MQKNNKTSDEMKIVIAIDSFKGTLSSVEAGNAIKKGIELFVRNTNIQVEIFPMADGGEGTLDSIYAFNKSSSILNTTVKDSLLRDISIPFIIIDEKPSKSAVIEMASIAGLPMLKKSELDVMKATTFGVGQCIKKALDLGAKKIYLGIGGSATNDAGIGMLQALGAKFLDKNNNNIKTGALYIGDITDIDLSEFDSRIKNTEFISICDVKNPFYGPDGATHIYGPQKGATAEQVIVIDKMFKNYAAIVFKKLGVDLQKIKGSGAGGGIGGSAAVFLNAEMKTGADWLIKYSQIEKSIAHADIIITGEGKTDTQTLNDKLPVRIGLICKKYNKKSIIISGDKSIGKFDMINFGINSVYALTDYFDINEAINNSNRCLTEATLNICKELFQTM